MFLSLFLLVGGAVMLALVAAAILSKDLQYSDVIVALTACLVSVLPVLIYASAILFACCIRWLPVSVLHIFLKATNAVASPDSPVFPRLGTIISLVFALLTIALRASA